MNISPIFYLPVFGAVGLVLLNWLYGFIGFLFRQELLGNRSHDLEVSYPQYDWNNQDLADDPEASPPVSEPRNPVLAVANAVAYNGPGKTEFVNEKCMICLARFKDGEVCHVLVNCKHVYHRECIDKWILRNSCCPICRVPAMVIRVSHLKETSIT